MLGLLCAVPRRILFPDITTSWRYWNLLDLVLVFDAARMPMIVLLTWVELSFLSFLYSTHSFFLRYVGLSCSYSWKLLQLRVSIERAFGQSELRTICNFSSENGFMSDESGALGDITEGAQVFTRVHAVGLIIIKQLQSTNVCNQIILCL